MTHGKLLDDGRYIIVAKSIDHAKCPELPGFVRGELYFGGYILEPLPSNPYQTRAIFLGRVDLKGNIPSWIVKLASELAPLAIEGIRNVLKKEDLTLFCRLTDGYEEKKQLWKQQQKELQQRIEKLLQKNKKEEETKKEQVVQENPLKNTGNSFSSPPIRKRKEKQGGNFKNKVTQFTGKENYEFGDITKKIVKNLSKAEYEF